MKCAKASVSILKVLCDETRLQILTMLAEKSMNGCEINRAFECTQPTISYHMKLLVDAQFVRAHKEGCCVIYSINNELWSYTSSLLEALNRTTDQKKDKCE